MHAVGQKPPDISSSSACGAARLVVRRRPYRERGMGPFQSLRGSRTRGSRPVRTLHGARTRSSDPFQTLHGARTRGLGPFQRLHGAGTRGSGRCRHGTEGERTVQCLSSHWAERRLTGRSADAPAEPVSSTLRHRECVRTRRAKRVCRLETIAAGGDRSTA